MPTVYHTETGESRAVDHVDARELIETGRWSAESPTEILLSSDDKGAVPGGSDSAPCLPADMTVIDLRAALKQAGVAMPHGASKAELVALYSDAQG